MQVALLVALLLFARTSMALDPFSQGRPQRNVVSGSNRFSQAVMDTIGAQLPQKMSRKAITSEVATTTATTTTTTSDVKTTGYLVQANYLSLDCTGTIAFTTVSQVGGCLFGNQVVSSVVLQSGYLTANYAIYFASCTGTPTTTYSFNYSTACSMGSQYSWQPAVTTPGTTYSSGYSVSSKYTSPTCSGSPYSVVYTLLNQCVYQISGYQLTSMAYSPGGYYSTVSYFAGSAGCIGNATSFYSNYHTANLCNQNAVLSYVSSLPVTPGTETVGYLVQTATTELNCLGDMSNVYYTLLNSSVCVATSPPTINSYFAGSTSYQVKNTYNLVNCLGPIITSTVTVVDGSCMAPTFPSTSSVSSTFSGTIQLPSVIGYGQSVYSSNSQCNTQMGMPISASWYPTYCVSTNFGYTDTICSAGGLYGNTFGNPACAGIPEASNPLTYPCSFTGTGYLGRPQCTTGSSYLPVNHTSGYLQVYGFSTMNCTGLPTSVTSTKIGGCFLGSYISSVVVNDYENSITAVGTDGETCSMSTTPITESFSTVCTNGVYAGWTASVTIPTGTPITGGYVQETEYAPSSSSTTIPPCSGPVESILYLAVGQCFNGMLTTLLLTSDNQVVSFFSGYANTDCSGAASFMAQQLVNDECSNNIRTKQVSSISMPSGSQLAAGYVEIAEFPGSTQCAAAQQAYYYAYPGSAECSAESFGSSLFEVLEDGSTIIQSYLEYSQGQCGGIASFAQFDYAVSGVCQNNQIVTSSSTIDLPYTNGILNLHYSSTSDCSTHTDPEYGEWLLQNTCIGSAIYQCYNGTITTTTFSGAGCVGSAVTSTSKPTCGLTSSQCTPIPTTVTTGYFVYSVYDNTGTCGVLDYSDYSALGACLPGSDETSSIINYIVIIGSQMSVTGQVFDTNDCSGPYSVQTQTYNNQCQFSYQYGWVQDITFQEPPAVGYLVSTSYYPSSTGSNDHDSCGPVFSEAFSELGACISLNGVSEYQSVVVPSPGVILMYTFQFANTNCAGSAYYVSEILQNVSGSCPEMAIAVSLPDTTGVDLGNGYLTSKGFSTTSCSGDILGIGYTYVGCDCEIAVISGFSDISFSSKAVSQSSSSVNVINVYLGTSTCGGSPIMTILTYFTPNTCVDGIFVSIDPSLQYPTSSGGYLQLEYQSAADCSSIESPIHGNWQPTGVCIDGTINACSNGVVIVTSFEGSQCSGQISDVENLASTCTQSSGELVTITCTSSASSGVISTGNVCGSSPSSSPTVSPAVIGGAVAGSIVGAGVICGVAYYGLVMAPAAALATTSTGTAGAAVTVVGATTPASVSAGPATANPMSMSSEFI